MPESYATGLLFIRSRQGFTDFAPFLITDFSRQLFSELPNALCHVLSAEVHDFRKYNQLKSIAYQWIWRKVCLQRGYNRLKQLVKNNMKIKVRGFSMTNTAVDTSSPNLADQLTTLGSNPLDHPSLTSFRRARKPARRK
jgi:hypothetical protein